MEDQLTMWIDRRTNVTKLIVAFRNFANASKNVQSHNWRMYKKYEMTTNEYVRKKHWLLTVGRSSGSWFAVSNCTGGDTQVPEVDFKESSAAVWRDKDLFSPPKSPHSKHASSQFLARLLLTAHSNQCPQSPCCQLQRVQARQSTSKPSWFSPLAHAQVRRLPQGHFDFDRELLNVGVQKLEDIFSMVLMNYRPWGQMA